MEGATLSPFRVCLCTATSNFRNCPSNVNFTTRYPRIRRRTPCENCRSQIKYATERRSRISEKYSRNKSLFDSKSFNASETRSEREWRRSGKTFKTFVPNKRHVLVNWNRKRREHSSARSENVVSLRPVLLARSLAFVHKNVS